jgi:hypothetical protein
LIDITWSLDHNLAHIDHVDKILKMICIQGILKEMNIIKASMKL